MNSLLSKFFFAVACLSCSLLNAFSQCPDSSQLNITATLYTQENGLTSNMLIGSSRDSTGYLYFLGLDSRWIRFDGTNFRVVNDISHIPFYNYFVVTFGSRSYALQYIDKTIYKTETSKDKTTRRWALKGDSLIYFPDNKSSREIKMLPPEIPITPLTSFYPDGDNCWITAGNKVWRFNLRSKKFQSILFKTSDEIRLPPAEPFIQSPSGGSPYLLTENSLLKLDNAGDAFEKFCAFPASLHGDVIMYVAIMDNYLFVVESNTTIDEVNLSTGIVNRLDLTDYSDVKNPSALKIISMIRYRDYLLIGTANAGLFIFNYCTRSMQHFQYEKQNSDAALANAVEWLAVHDEENVIWMQTNAGLIKLEVNNQFMKTFLPSSAKSGGVCNNCNNVRAIYSYNNNELLVGSFEGVYTFNLASGQFGNLFSSADGQPVWNESPAGAITGDGKGNVFIANWADSGILLLNNEEKKLINLLPPGHHPEVTYDNMRCLFYDSHHVLWAGTNNGFLRITNLDEFEKNNFTGRVVATNQFPGKSHHTSQLKGDCFTITEDTKENIWLGTRDGLFVYNYKTDSVIKYFHLEGNNSSLSNNDVRSVYVSKKGDVWIGTSGGGLNHFDAPTKSFTAFTKGNGLPDNSIYTILEDNNGFLWMGTNAGLCRLSLADYSVRNYTPRDGIQNFEFNTNAVCKTADGKFCFGGRTGFNIFHPDSMNTTISPPQVVITGFKIFDKEFPVTDSVYHLSHDQNSFTFDFAALNYYRSNDNQYMYRMEGADKNWIKPGNRQFTTYNNLAPGHYRFMVRAANYTGAWNEVVTTMSFVIAPAWYNTLLFRIAIALLIVTGIYFFYRYRLRQVVKLQAVRNRIASDLHDEIGSTLSSISLSSTVIQNKLDGKNPEVTKLLQQVSNNTDNMMEAMSDIVWTINARNDRFDNVINRMRAFAIEILEPKDCIVHFDADKNLSELHLDMVQRKNLYLIFKEAINNAAKYSACKNVWIDISLTGNKKLEMNIKDDGKGFQVPVGDEGTVSLSGNGIRNMKKRAEELGGELMIDSERDQGVTLNLKFMI